MSHSPELIYKTTSPTALDWWKDITKEHDRVRELRAAYEAEALNTFGPVGKRYSHSEDDPTRRLVVSRHIAVGLACRYDEHPPAGSGWRLDAKTDWWMPSLRSALGKTRRAELEELIMPDIRDLAEVKIGVPSIVWAGNDMIHSPGFQFDEKEQALYVTWGSGRCAEDFEESVTRVPEIAWESVPRSVWYAREEAKAAAESNKN